MSKKPWGGIGGWAAEAEREEAEEREAAVKAESQSFPSLKEAATAKPKKKKKNVLSLSEFNVGGYVAPGGGGSRRDSVLDNKGLTHDEMLRLPTGPKERSAEEMQYGGRLGGGFSGYGGRSGSGPGRRDNDNDGSWGGGAGRRSYGGFDDDRRAPPPRVSDFDQPFRADEVDNWGMGKKPMSSFGGDSRGGNCNNRYESLGGGGIGGGSFSRADEVDSWAMGKKPLPVPVRSSTFGSGFRDPGVATDRWARGELAEGDRVPDRERARLVLNPPSGNVAGIDPVKSNKPSPFGAARPREDVLTEKGIDWKKVDSDLEVKKTSRPTSSHSSRPSSPQSNKSGGQVVIQGVEAVLKPKPKVNPFGDAKPREVLLEEKGKDWRKIDRELEHRGIDRPETEEEKILKVEIDQLKKKLESQITETVESESLQGPGGDESGLHDIILSKEKDLELLIRDFDDKVRFGQKAIERPGSGTGRVSSFSERLPSQSGSYGKSMNVEFMDRPQSRGTGDVWPRPPSQSGRYEESRNVEIMDRPRSRGPGDVWPRPPDERRGYQGGRGGGFLGNRDVDRSKDKW